MNFTPVSSEGAPISSVPMVDVEEILTSYLRAELGAAATVGLSVPDGDLYQQGLLPFVRVARFAGTADHFAQVDRPQVDIDIWESTNTGVNAAAALVRPLIAAIRWLRCDEMAVITETAETVGPQRISEDDPLLVRLNFQVGLTVRLLPG